VITAIETHAATATPRVFQSLRLISVFLQSGDAPSNEKSNDEWPGRVFGAYTFAVAGSVHAVRRRRPRLSCAVRVEAGVVVWRHSAPGRHRHQRDRCGVAVVARQADGTTRASV
jgi:hypothetical protein